MTCSLSVIYQRGNHQMTCSLCVRNTPLVSYTKGTCHLIITPLVSYAKGTRHLVIIHLVSYTKGTRHLVSTPLIYYTKGTRHFGDYSSSILH
jgi:hypothetical protein